MGIPSAHPSFAKLHAEWEQRLAASGLVDAESSEAERRVARTRGSMLLAERSGRTEYFRRAGWWLWEQIWSSRLERRTWELHADGWGVRVIERLLGTARGSSYRLVEQRVKAQRKLMFEAAPDRDAPEVSAFDEELEGFRHITDRGEGAA